MLPIVCLWAFAPPSIFVVVMFSRLREPSSDPSRHLFFRRCCGMSFFCSRHLSSTCCGLSSRPSDPSRPLFFRRYCGRRPIPLVHLFLDVVVRCHSSPLVIRRLCLTLLWAVLVRLCSPTPFLSFAALPSWHHRYPPIHLTSLLPPAICSCRFGDHRPAYTTPL